MVKRDRLHCSSQLSLKFRPSWEYHLTKEGELATRRLSRPTEMFGCSAEVLCASCGFLGSVILGLISDIEHDKQEENKMDPNLLLQCPDCHVPLALEVSDIRTFQVSSSGVEIYCPMDMIEKPERQSMRLFCQKCKKDFPFEIKTSRRGGECIVSYSSQKRK